MKSDYLIIIVIALAIVSVVDASLEEEQETNSTNSTINGTVPQYFDYGAEFLNRTGANVSSTILDYNNNNTMLFAVEYSKNPVSVGDVERITVTVLDSNTNKPIPDVKVDMSIIPPDNYGSLSFANTTDAQGKVSYTVPINNDASMGEYSNEIQATKDGYSESGDYSHFIVVPRV